MLVMVVSIAHRLFAQIAKMVSAVMTQHACASSDGREIAAAKSLVVLTARTMEVNATMATVFVQLALQEFSARHVWTSAPTNAVATAFVMNGPSNAIARTVSLALIAR